jgi:tripartite-type tricarboxylate transporter receptor subunit TctC
MSKEKTMKKNLYVAMALALCTLLANPLFAGGGAEGGKSGAAKTGYPTKAVETLVGYAAGGASDIIARIVAEHLGKELGQSIVVQNKAGAGGEIAYTAIATAKKDGYTLGYINAPATMSIPFSHKTNYTMDDFVFIGNVIYHENLIIVAPDGPYKNYNDLAAAIKKNPGKITVGNSGAYADDHLASLKWQFETGLSVEDTMFQGTGPSIVALMGKHIDAVICNVADAVQKSRDKQIVVVATMGEKRNPEFPNAPTLNELGFKVNMGNYTTLAAPKGTPEEVVRILRDGLKKAVSSEVYVKSCTDAGLPIKYIDAQEIEKIYTQSNEDLKKLWKDLSLSTSTK